VTDLTRRRVLVSGLAAGTAVALPAVFAAATPAGATGSRPELPGDPFTLGVASGDPDHDGFVLWTRLAPQPLADDGLGGMPNRAYEVRWQIAEDPRFRRIVRQGEAEARPSWGHSVHIELNGLRPDREYWYRFRVGSYVSPVGRTRTAPRPDALVRQVAMAFASCSQFEHGYFTAGGDGGGVARCPCGGRHARYRRGSDHHAGSAGACR
jgi:alkaline phosphatase D